MSGIWALKYVIFTLYVLVSKFKKWQPCIRKKESALARETITHLNHRTQHYVETLCLPFAVQRVFKFNDNCFLTLFCFYSITHARLSITRELRCNLHSNMTQIKGMKILSRNGTDNVKCYIIFLYMICSYHTVVFVAMYFQRIKKYFHINKL